MRITREGARSHRDTKYMESSECSIRWDQKARQIEIRARMVEDFRRSGGQDDHQRKVRYDFLIELSNKEVADLIEKVVQVVVEK